MAVGAARTGLAHLSKAVAVTATVTNIASSQDCPAPSARFDVVAVPGAGGGAVLFVVAVDQGATGDESSATVDRVENSLRLD